LLLLTLKLTAQAGDYNLRYAQIAAPAKETATRTNTPNPSANTMLTPSTVVQYPLKALLWDGGIVRWESIQGNPDISSV